jgi:hypothetical protein
MRYIAMAALPDDKDEPIREPFGIYDLDAHRGS